MKSNRESIDVKKENRREPDLQLTSADFVNNEFELPAELKEKMTKEGLAWRFVNAAKFRDDFGVHRSGWMPYNVHSGGVFRSLKGVSPDGVLMRGDLVLAVRSVERSQQYRAHLKKLNKQQDNFNKTAADELRYKAREAGVDATIIEGYDKQKMGGDND